LSKIRPAARYFIDRRSPIVRWCFTRRRRGYGIRIPVLFVHHGVGRNGRDYRDYWLNLVDKAGILAISIESPEASFPEHLW
jgi:hypothetical protein